MKKYDFVRVTELIEINKAYKDLGQHFVGAEAMVIGIDNRMSDYQIELCFFDRELQEFAMSEGFDYWRKEELELI